MSGLFSAGYWSEACIEAGPLGDDGGQFYTLGKERQHK